tara:strand:+ start:3539 stop:3769 length:231 start_codon:yes stop_codon:yes gene_type:complete
MFELMFRQNNKYKQLNTTESEKFIPKDTGGTCPFCFKLKKTKKDISFKTYMMDATMHKGKYLLTYEQWIKKLKVNN